MVKNLFRVAAATPRVHIGNVTKNCEEIEKIYNEYKYKADVIVTPELSLTGYTCADLFENRHLIDNALKGLTRLAGHTDEENGAALVVGLPVERAGELFNCAAWIHGGRVIAIIPKT